MQAEILGEVNDLYACIYLVFLQEFLGFTMAHAEKEKVDLVIQLFSKAKIRFTDQVAMNLIEGITCIALAMYKNNLRRRMIQ